MLHMRPLNGQDVLKIRQWPPYPGDMAQMDYALREGGWLDECRAKPDTFLYAFDDDDELAAFTILAGTGPTTAEFRIALRTDQTGLGLGKDITLMTLHTGFEDHGLSSIHLIVRKNNQRGIGLYRRIGFRDQGECRREIHGADVDFWLMEIDGEEYFRLHGQEMDT